MKNNYTVEYKSYRKLIETVDGEATPLVQQLTCVMLTHTHTHKKKKKKNLPIKEYYLVLSC
jgi:hypothetical protein